MTPARKTKARVSASKPARITLRLNSELDARLRLQAKRLKCSITDIVLVALAGEGDAVRKARLAATLVQIGMTAQSICDEHSASSARLIAILERYLVAPTDVEIDTLVQTIRYENLSNTVRLGVVVEKTRIGMAMLTEAN